MSDADLKALVASLAEAQKKTDEQLSNTDAKLDRIAAMIGGVSNNQGDVAEEFFYNALAKTPQVGSLSFDTVTKNIGSRRGNVEDEFDLVLYNGDSVMIIEVKYKVHPKDVRKVAERKIPNFRTLFPMFGDYRIYGAIAGFYIPDDAVELAKEAGLFIIRRTGELIVVDAAA